MGSEKTRVKKAVGQGGEKEKNFAVGCAEREVAHWLLLMPPPSWVSWASVLRRCGGEAFVPCRLMILILVAWAGALRIYVGWAGSD